MLTCRKSIFVLLKERVFRDGGLWMMMLGARNKTLGNCLGRSVLGLPLCFTTNEPMVIVDI